MGYKQPPNTTEDFWRRVDKTGDPDGCWNWTGFTMGNGYGGFRMNKRHYQAHRLSYTLTRGEIPPGLVVMHLCDNRRCVNPDHLEAGTQGDNLRDMFRKGRYSRRRNRGPNLTPEQVIEIRRRAEAGEKGVDLAREFGISPSHVSTIKTRAYYADLPDDPRLLPPRPPGRPEKQRTGYRGENNGNKKLTPAQVREIRRRAQTGEPGLRIAQDYGVTSGAIYKIVHRQTWTHL